MALRDAGLLDALADAGIDVLDLGDVPGFRWRPDHRSPRAMNVAAVARVARDVADRVREARAGGRLPLVMGGDCTIELGTVAGFADADPAPGLLYFDRIQTSTRRKRCVTARWTGWASRTCSTFPALLKNSRPWAVGGR